MTLEKATKVVEYMAGAPSDDERSLDIAVATLIVRMQAEIDTLKQQLREAGNPGPAHGDLRFGPGGSSTYGQ